jgi:hypothetical protein
LRVDHSPEAGTYIRERGASLYLYRSRLAGYRVSLKPPRREISFDAVDVGGFTFHIDPEIERTDVIEISLRRRPWGRIRVRGLRTESPGAVVGGDGGVVSDKDVIWDTGDSGGFGGDGGAGDGGGGGNGGG